MLEFTIGLAVATLIGCFIYGYCVLQPTKTSYPEFFVFQVFEGRVDDRLHTNEWADVSDHILGLVKRFEDKSLVVSTFRSTSGVETVVFIFEEHYPGQCAFIERQMFIVSAPIAPEITKMLIGSISRKFSSNNIQFT